MVAEKLAKTSGGEGKSLWKTRDFKTQDARKEEFEQELLKRLVALNHARAEEEKRGLIRWLRPEYQAPESTPKPEQKQIDLGPETTETPTDRNTETPITPPRPCLSPETGYSPAMSPIIQRTPGVCGGEAFVGMTRIAVWMLEEARRSGVGDLELLKDYPGLSVFDLEAAWQYLEDHAQEIHEAIQRNREA